MTSRLTQPLERLVSVRAKPLPPRVRSVLLVVSVALFVVFLVVAWLQRPAGRDLAWFSIVVAALVVSPALLGLKVLEFRAAADLLDQRTSVSEAVDVAVMGAAANLLPIPGSAIVSAHTLSARGVSALRSAASVATVGLAWLGVSSLAGGLVIAATGRLGAATLVIGPAVLLCVAAAASITRSVGGRRPLRRIVVVLAIETAFLALAVLRLALVAAAVGLDVDAWRLGVFPMAAAIGTATGLVPAGLGVREGIMAFLAPIVGLSFGDGLLLGVIDRIVWLVGLLGASLGVFTVRRLRTVRPG